MHRYHTSNADRLLDTWRGADRAETATVQRQLAALQGPHGETTLQRRHAAAPFAVRQRFARLSPRQRTREQAIPPSRHRTLLPLRLRRPARTRRVPRGKKRSPR